MDYIWSHGHVGYIWVQCGLSTYNIYIHTHQVGSSGYALGTPIWVRAETASNSQHRLLSPSQSFLWLASTGLMIVGANSQKYGEWLMNDWWMWISLLKRAFLSAVSKFQQFWKKSTHLPIWLCFIGWFQVSYPKNHAPKSAIFDSGNPDPIWVCPTMGILPNCQIYWEVILF